MGGGYYWNDKGGNTLITDFTSGKTQAAGVNQLPADKATNMRMYNGLSNLLCSDGGYGNQRMVYSYHTILCEAIVGASKERCNCIVP
jgi:hypothetical protein